MAESLEGEKTKVEGEKVTPKEALKPTQPKEKSTVSIAETPEFRTALDIALGKGLESTNRQLSLAQTEVREAKTERDDFKSQVLSKDNEIEDVRADIKIVEERLKDISSDDPNKFDLVQRERELKQEDRRLKAERLVLDTDKQAQAETVKLAGDTLREVNIWNIASEFKDSDPARLKDLCNTLEVQSEEQIRKVAETIWAKKETETQLPFQVATSGGGDNIGSLSPQERVKEADKRLRV